MHSAMDFRNDPDAGSWLQVHSTSEAMSVAKSSMFATKSFGIINLFEEVTTKDACRYSSFDFSSSAETPSAV